jgi:hypothetical protein
MTGDAVDNGRPRPVPVAPWIFRVLIVPFGLVTGWGAPAMWRVEAAIGVLGLLAFFAIVHRSPRPAGSQAR